MNRILIIVGMAVIAASPLLTSAETHAQGVYGKYYDQYYIFDPKHKEIVGRPIRQWPGEHEYCMRDAKRGEYETRDEYKSRKEKVVRKCASYWPLKDAVVRKTGRLLSYNADRETFNFGIHLGTIGVPTKRPGILSRQDERELCERKITCCRKERCYYNNICWVAELNTDLTKTDKRHLDGDLKVKGITYKG